MTKKIVVRVNPNNYPKTWYPGVPESIAININELDNAKYAAAQLSEFATDFCERLSAQRISLRRGYLRS